MILYHPLLAIFHIIDGLKKIAFFYLILDEATQIKNPSARRSQAIKSLNAVHRLALSGTPIENRPAELWSIYDFLMPGHLGKYGTFQQVFEDQITSGDTQAAQQLGRRIRWNTHPARQQG
jgi:SNF2 family DNA or RNA helicase